MEKIGKTLDKLTTNHNKTQQPLPPSVASTAAWIYPTAFYHHHPAARIVPPPPPVPPAHHYYLAHAHQPWETYYGEFFEYPVTSPPATRNNAYCACYDNLHGTVRRRTSPSNKCKHCQKSKKPGIRLKIVGLLAFYSLSFQFLSLR